MSDLPLQPSVADEQLVAYLDNELGPQERARVERALQHNARDAERLDLLRRSEIPFRQAFDSVLLEAPHERLHAMLDRLKSPTQAAPGLSRRRFLAVAASCMLAGVVADRLFLNVSSAPPSPHGWRALVAEYMALYTPATLDNLDPDPVAQNRQLASVGARLGLKLDTERVGLAQPQLKRAQILEYDGVPIAQITYLDPQFGPLALCITANAQGPATQGREQRLGMNVVYWSTAEHAFMLIGRNSLDDLNTLSEQLKARLQT